MTMRYPSKLIPNRLGLYTQKIVKPVFKARGLVEGKIVIHWDQIVGEKISSLSLAEKITFPRGKRSDGTLHLCVTSSGALFCHYAQDLILEQVNTYFGYKAVSKLRLTHGLEKSKVKKSWPIKDSPLLTEEQKVWVRKTVQDVKDQDLKVCLEKLAYWMCDQK